MLPELKACGKLEQFEQGRRLLVYCLARTLYLAHNCCDERRPGQVGHVHCNLVWLACRTNGEQVENGETGKDTADMNKLGGVWANPPSW